MSICILFIVCPCQYVIFVGYKIIYQSGILWRTYPKHIFKKYFKNLLVNIYLYGVQHKYLPVWYFVSEFPQYILKNILKINWMLT